MICGIFSVFDAAVKAYLPPFFARSKGEAIRSFSDAVNTEGHQFKKHSGDYSLWYLGEFDDSNAGFAVGVVERVVGAHEVVELSTSAGEQSPSLFSQMSANRAARAS